MRYYLLHLNFTKLWFQNYFRKVNKFSAMQELENQNKCFRYLELYQLSNYDDFSPLIARAIEVFQNHVLHK